MFRYTKRTLIVRLKGHKMSKRDPSTCLCFIIVIITISHNTPHYASLSDFWKKFNRPKNPKCHLSVEDDFFLIELWWVCVYSERWIKSAMKGGVFSAPGDYIYFKSQVPLHKIPVSDDSISFSIFPDLGFFDFALSQLGISLFPIWLCFACFLELNLIIWSCSDLLNWW